MAPITPPRRGSELIAAALERQGVRTVFTLCGHLDITLGALDDRGIRVVDTRNEASAVLAADAYSRVTNSLGVAIVTAGPGVSNAMAGIAVAWEACSPLLVITGRDPLRIADTGVHGDLQHPVLVREQVKWARTVWDPSRLGEYVDRACRIALAGRPGPVVLDIPSDLQTRAVDAAAVEASLAPLPAMPRVIPDPVAIEAAARLIETAQRPIVIAGGGARRGAGSAEALQRLAARGLPVIGRGGGRGLVAEDHVSGFGWPLAQDAAAEADVVLLAGTRLNRSIGFGAPPQFRDEARFIQIELDPAEVGRNRLASLVLQADAGLALSALAARLERSDWSSDGGAGWVAAGVGRRLARLDALLETPPGSGTHPLAAGRALALRMAPDAIVVGDGANCLNWYKAALPIGAGGQYLDHEPWGCMGVGVPFSLGARAAVDDIGHGRQVVLVTGDGAFGYYLADLEAAARQRLPFVALVANDAGWGANRNTQSRAIGRSVATDLSHASYAQVALGLGCRGLTVQSPADLDDALQRSFEAAAAGQPAVVDVLVDPAASNDRGTDPLLQMVSFNPHWPRTMP